MMLEVAQSDSAGAITGYEKGAGKTATAQRAFTELSRAQDSGFGCFLA